VAVGVEGQRLRRAVECARGFDDDEAVDAVVELRQVDLEGERKRV
jgi:hypothetical protein